jgi:hypothetical protein
MLLYLYATLYLLLKQILSLNENITCKLHPKTNNMFIC